ncbi:M20/M25/M40 family metallo-hydrolase [Luteimicrobium sp. DT211]|uniref:M20/M25/M40 family metallo-hydrolase n=1 Tax=Luteimicrobium sp. DT211 TaxID=3393412 RepID=UPI003CE904F9
MTPTLPTPDDVAARLSALVRVPTVSSRVAEEVDAARFAELVALLEALYPHVHRVLERELVTAAPDAAEGHSLLFRWRGTGGEAGEREPVVLMAHYDVVAVPGLPVPVDDVAAPAAGWTHPPFAGVVRDGVVWGRGTLDDKGALVVVLEAVEALVASGWVPPRDVYLSFGHNEETAGDGAREAVRRLGERRIRPWLVLDEGGAVVQGAMPGVAAPTAVVGIAEKGILDLELSTRDDGGHASTPAANGATVRLARAITRIDAHPFPPRLSEPVRALLATLADHVDGPMRRVFANAGRLAPVVARAFTRLGVEPAALVRTTVAITQLEGSPGANVLAQTARANANIRILPGETVASVVARLTRVIDDPTITLRVVSGEDPSPVSPAEGTQWELLRTALAASYPDAVLTPYVQLGASDSRHYCAISAHVYRFSPFDLTTAQRASIHGIDEHVTVAALGRGVAFTAALLRAVPPPDATGATPPPARP